MFRVPVDAAAPTFDATFKVGWWRWLTSSRADRVEWARRRNAAAQLAGANLRQRTSTAAAEAKARYEVASEASRKSWAPAKEAFRQARRRRRRWW
jgi:hypothetical protein